MSTEYGIRYREDTSLWGGPGYYERPSDDGSLDAAERAAQFYLEMGHRGVRIVRLAPDGTWKTVRKVSPGRELVRKMRYRLLDLVSRDTYEAPDDLPDGFALTLTTSGMWLLDLPDRDGLGEGCIEDPDPVTLRHTAWALDDLAATGLLPDVVRAVTETPAGGTE